MRRLDYLKAYFNPHLQAASREKFNWCLVTPISIACNWRRRVELLDNIGCQVPFGYSVGESHRILGSPVLKEDFEQSPFSGLGMQSQTQGCHDLENGVEAGGAFSGKGFVEVFPGEAGVASKSTDFPSRPVFPQLLS